MRRRASRCRARCLRPRVAARARRAATLSWQLSPTATLPPACGCSVAAMARVRCWRRRRGVHRSGVRPDPGSSRGEKCTQPRLPGALRVPSPATKHPCLLQLIPFPHTHLPTPTHPASLLQHPRCWTSATPPLWGWLRRQRATGCPRAAPSSSWCIQSPEARAATPPGPPLRGSPSNLCPPAGRRRPGTRPAGEAWNSAVWPVCSGAAQLSAVCCAAAGLPPPRAPHWAVPGGPPLGCPAARHAASIPSSAHARWR